MSNKINIWDLVDFTDNEPTFKWDEYKKVPKHSRFESYYPSGELKSITFLNRQYIRFYEYISLTLIIFGEFLAPNVARNDMR